ncbi:hypothetical protein J5N97_013569 [Dioscorea zingiberensis]|uniref:Uncharacterized protein n=1 Tax=Dioscorea zingiberensis TaxID=325984 RepID=A0A9D5CQU3_9LILI|nr:hypothetical protein J5N97_013562 [Dioscorea zingiberensis]KAJ0978095.1 hypothetical protein J5N97_013569 [Dioscorea zingiberensis]
MPWSYLSLGSRIRSWLRDYDRLQALAVILLYIQIGCSLVGSLSALYNGVLLINLVVALFALVAIESSSQSLGRTYAVLLFCAILLDIAWFIFMSHTMWNMDHEKYEPFVIFSLRLALSMQIIGFSVRFLSSFLWIQMYRLGISSVDSAPYRETDFDVRNSFLNPPIHGIVRENSTSDDILGGSIYDPTYYSSLFEDAQEKGCVHQVNNGIGHDGGSTSSAETPQLKSCVSRSFQVIDVDNSLRKPLNC